MVWIKQNLQRSYSCNSKLLKHYRQKRGWTQKELAAQAGYGEDLISKAERGKQISTETIDDIAESLSTTETPLYPEDLISDPLQLVKDYVTIFYLHQKETVNKFRDFLDDDFTIKIVGDRALIPFAGEYHGLEEAKKYYHLFFSILEVPEDHDHRPLYKYVVEGKDVVALGECWIHPIGKPLQSPMKITCHFNFQRGKLVLFDEMFDTHKGIQALQGDEI